MSIYLYEDAIVNKMKEITNNTLFMITPQEVAIDIIAGIKDDSIHLPLVHMSRNSWGFRDNGSNRFNMKMQGHINNDFPMYNPTPGLRFNFEDISGQDGKIHRIYNMPIQFSHTFYVYSQTRRENDEIVRELLWFFGTMPEFKVLVPYDINKEFVFNLELGDSVEDIRNMSSHKEIGQIFIQSFTTACRDAYLWKSGSHNPICIDVDVELASDTRERIITQDYNQLKREEVE